jgi:hypothetical protein
VSAETPAATIRRAASLMRERAEQAQCDGMTRSPWRVGETADCGCCEKVTDATGSLIAAVDDRQSAHIASWHPLVALTVADWLDAAERAAELTEAQGAWLHPEAHAFKVARAYLDEVAS